MTGQYSGLVRDRSPETSWDAAALQTPEKINAVQRAVIVLLGTRGPMTDEELVDAYAEYATGRSQVPAVTPQSVRTRRHELHVAAKVRPSGVRRPTRAGSTAQVWELTKLGDPGEATA